MVRKKSAGVGCLNDHRRMYSRNTGSNRSGEVMCSRSSTSPSAGLLYSACRQFSLLCIRSAGVMIACSSPESAFLR